MSDDTDASSSSADVASARSDLFPSGRTSCSRLRVLRTGPPQAHTAEPAHRRSEPRRARPPGRTTPSHGAPRGRSTELHSARRAHTAMTSRQLSPAKGSLSTWACCTRVLALTDSRTTPSVLCQVEVALDRPQTLLLRHRRRKPSSPPQTRTPHHLGPPANKQGPTYLRCYNHDRLHPTNGHGTPPGHARPMQRRMASPTTDQVPERAAQHASRYPSGTTTVVTSRDCLRAQR